MVVSTVLLQERQEGPLNVCGIYFKDFRATLNPSMHGAAGRRSMQQVLG